MTLRRTLLAAVHAAGALSLIAPLLIPGARHGAAHAHDAPILLALIVPGLVAIAVAEVTSGRLDAKAIALLGVLCALNAALRVPGAIGGASLVFFLPILCAAVFGATFGFLLGSLSFAVSAIVTAGIGPWLPFQMLAAGWLAAGGAMAKPLIREHRLAALALLGAYSYLAGFAFGALTDLWFWPYLSAGQTPLSWQPGMGLARGMKAFWRFYASTSLAWDAGRAIGNVVLVAALGSASIRLLERARRRMWVAF